MVDDAAMTDPLRPQCSARPPAEDTLQDESTHGEPQIERHDRPFCTPFWSKFPVGPRAASDKRVCLKS